MPAVYLSQVPAAEPGNERLVLLNMYNWGVKELEVIDVIWAGPIDPRNDYPISPLNIGGIIPSGGQSFYAVYLTDEANCENNVITATFITNQYNTCPETYNFSTFSFEVVFSDEYCEDDDNDDIGGGRSSAKAGAGRPFGDVTEVSAFRVFPSVTSATITIACPEEKTTGNRKYLISNLAGQIVLRGTFIGGSPTGEVDVTTLPVGGYFISLEGATSPLRFFRR